ncbi:hypothetical protein CAOG_009560 [Capsaspora owczarzaki ATCC 30864]|uniref:Uncharacterized protein n=2 Tax=Capsaspora owczarzaki (strain ATCC 30864) TaxID=595528 RepID=A0A0D2WMI3_CAPO3|nr:hypothetical protein CAOG_009560 [Capsaspora owczarzaki ATCC 30864]
MYYKPNAYDKPAGIIDLSRCSKVSLVDREVTEHAFSFAIVTESRTYYLFAQDEPELQAWVNELTVAARKSSKMYSSADFTPADAGAGKPKHASAPVLPRLGLLGSNQSGGGGGGGASKGPHTSVVTRSQQSPQPNSPLGTSPLSSNGFGGGSDGGTSPFSAYHVYESPSSLRKPAEGQSNGQAPASIPSNDSTYSVVGRVQSHYSAIHVLPSGDEYHTPTPAALYSTPQQQQQQQQQQSNPASDTSMQPVLNIQQLLQQQQQSAPHSPQERPLSPSKGLFGAVDTPASPSLKAAPLDDGDHAATLFRGNSVASKMMTTFGKLIAGQYLVRTLQDVIMDIMSGKLPMEVDPSKLGMLTDEGPGSPEDFRSGASSPVYAESESSGGASATWASRLTPVQVATLAENCANLSDACEKILFAIVNSISDAPSDLRLLCFALKEEISEIYPQLGVKMVGSFLFLRLINPAIAMPTQFGVIDADVTISPATRRALLLCTKILINLVNGVEFGHKEPFMIPFNQFISANAVRLEEFITSFATAPASFVSERAPTNGVAGAASNAGESSERNPLSELEIGLKTLSDTVEKLIYQSEDEEPSDEMDAIKTALNLYDEGERSALLTMLVDDLDIVAELFIVTPLAKVDQLVSSLVHVFHHQREAQRLLRYSISRELNRDPLTFATEGATTSNLGFGGTIKQGWLLKANPKKDVPLMRKKRWFVLKERGQLLYYKSVAADVPLGQVDVNSQCLIDQETPELTRQHGFQLINRTRTFRLFAKSVEEREEWIQALTAVRSSSGSKQREPSRVRPTTSAAPHTKRLSADGNGTPGKLSNGSAGLLSQLTSGKMSQSFTAGVINKPIPNKPFNGGTVRLPVQAEDEEVDSMDVIQSYSSPRRVSNSGLPFAPHSPLHKLAAGPPPPLPESSLRPPSVSTMPPTNAETTNGHGGDSVANEIRVSLGFLDNAMQWSLSSGSGDDPAPPVAAPAAVAAPAVAQAAPTLTPTNFLSAQSSIDDVLSMLQTENEKHKQQQPPAKRASVSLDDQLRDLDLLTKAAPPIAPLSLSAVADLPVCGKCTQQILPTDLSLTALDKTWHAHHFTCAECDKQLVANYFPKDGRAYCPEDYNRLFAVVCHGCNKLVEGSIVSAGSFQWHPECFVCAQCSSPLSVFRTVNGKFLCPMGSCKSGELDLCDGCGKSLVGGCLEVLSKKLHLECFKCKVCQQSLQGQKFFDQGGFPVCDRDFRISQGHVCYKCKDALDDDAVMALNQKFHKRCFVCAFPNCDLQLSTIRFFVVKDQPYCQQHSQQAMQQS